MSYQTNQRREGPAIIADVTWSNTQVRTGASPSPWELRSHSLDVTPPDGAAINDFIIYGGWTATDQEYFDSQAGRVLPIADGGSGKMRVYIGGGDMLMPVTASDADPQKVDGLIELSTDRDGYIISSLRKPPNAEVSFRGAVLADRASGVTFRFPRFTMVGAFPDVSAWIVHEGFLLNNTRRMSGGAMLGIARVNAPPVPYR